VTVRILIADDHKIVRDGLRSLLEAREDWSVVGEASDGREAVELARAVKPDVVVIDVAMPELNGIDATSKLVNLPDQPKVVALSMHSDRNFVAGMLRAGASAYLRKESAFDEIARAIETVLQDKTFLGDGITGVVVESYRELIARETPASTPLTAREREVLQLIAEGHKTVEIAAALYVSSKTIETHRRQIMEKLGLHSVPELTKYAIRHGLTSVDC
jgi:DNA-binding NarL/FixJ family response regulator